MSASLSASIGPAPARASSSIAGVTRAARSWAMVSYSRTAQPAGFRPKQRSLSLFFAAMAPTTMTEPCLESTFLPSFSPKNRAKEVTVTPNTAPPAATARSASRVSLSSQNRMARPPRANPPRKRSSAFTSGAM